MPSSQHLRQHHGSFCAPVAQRYITAVPRRASHGSCCYSSNNSARLFPCTAHPDELVGRKPAARRSSRVGTVRLTRSHNRCDHPRPQNATAGFHAMPPYVVTMSPLMGASTKNWCTSSSTARLHVSTVGYRVGRASSGARVALSPDCNVTSMLSKAKVTLLSMSSSEI